MAGGDADLLDDEVAPERCSLTQCSTCRRVFISMKRRVPSASSRNSMVPAPT
jgi:hypothetical protein